MASKKPTLKRFREVAKMCNGVKMRMADALGVYRLTIDNWCNADPEFAAVINEYSLRLVDEAAQVARAVALGIPEIDPVTKKVVGWKEKPDPGMLKYILSTKGRKEGWGENVDVTSGGKAIDGGFRVEIVDRREQVDKTTENDE